MSNTTLIILGVVALIVITVALLLMRKPAAPKPIAPTKPAPAEGHGVADSAAAAFLDVSGPVIGIDAHPDLPSDDLTRIKGLGPRASAALNAVGILRYAQLADLDPAQAAEVDARMGSFKGRIQRDQWIEQARLLEQDDIAGFEAKYGKIG
jgi:predicted flap endonuclease-1-like 5' DNA nuclease